MSARRSLGLGQADCPIRANPITRSRPVTYRRVCRVLVTRLSARRSAQNHAGKRPLCTPLVDGAPAPFLDAARRCSQTRLGLIGEPTDDALWSVSSTDVSEAPIDVDFVACRAAGHIAPDHHVHQLAVAVTGKPVQVTA